MINVGHNYGKKISCPVCKLEENDTQEHLFNCFVIKMTSKELYSMTECEYQDIFSLDLKKLIKVSKICESVARKREELVN